MVTSNIVDLSLCHLSSCQNQAKIRTIIVNPQISVFTPGPGSFTYSHFM